MVAEETGAEAGGAQILGNTLQNPQEHAEMGYRAEEGHAHKDGAKVDEEIESAAHLANPPHEGGMGETGAFPRHAGGYAGEGEPSGGAAGLNHVHLEVGATTGRPKASKAAKRKQRAKTLKWARMAPLQAPDTHFQLHA